ncbi:MAG TPA: tetratricopeptide repeat-containing protein, partial [Longimicrobium sp.]|nr:tetratricopeptide repeat-containing protein [Longimicrobium sp.]
MLMRQVFTAAALLVLCCAARATAGKSVDTRLAEAQQAFDEGTRLKQAGKYAEAMALTERALALREAVLGGTHPEVASCLDLLGDVHRRLGGGERAVPLLERALAIRETALGKHHPDVATSLHSLGTLFYVQGLYARAEPLFE